VLVTDATRVEEAPENKEARPIYLKKQEIVMRPRKRKGGSIGED